MNFSQDNFFGYVYAASYGYRIKVLTNQYASENSQRRTGNKLWGASCEVKPSIS